MIAAIDFDDHESSFEGLGMIRWVVVIFIALVIFPVLLPWLEKLGIGRLPGDVRFKLFGKIFCLPFSSTLLISALAFLAAKLLQ